MLKKTLKLQRQIAQNFLTSPQCCQEGSIHVKGGIISVGLVIEIIFPGAMMRAEGRQPAQNPVCHAGAHQDLVSGTRATILPVISWRWTLLEQCFSHVWSCIYALHICAALLLFKGAESSGRDSSCRTSWKNSLRFQPCAQGKYIRWPEFFLLQLVLSNQTGSKAHTSWAMPFSDGHIKCQGKPSCAVQWVLI